MADYKYQMPERSNPMANFYMVYPVSSSLRLVLTQDPEEHSAMVTLENIHKEERIEHGLQISLTDVPKIVTALRQAMNDSRSWGTALSAEEHLGPLVLDLFDYPDILPNQAKCKSGEAITILGSSVNPEHKVQSSLRGKYSAAEGTCKSGQNGKTVP